MPSNSYPLSELTWLWTSCVNEALKRSLDTSSATHVDKYLAFAAQLAASAPARTASALDALLAVVDGESVPERSASIKRKIQDVFDGYCCKRPRGM